MNRTPEEEREYQRLSAFGRQMYNMQAKNNPTAPHSKILTITNLSVQITEGIDEGWLDPKLGPLEKYKILEKMDDTMKSLAPYTWKKVGPTIMEAMKYLDGLVRRGIDWIDDKIVSPIRDFIKELFG